MEIISIILSVPILLLLCWALGGLLGVVCPDLEQGSLEQIVVGAIILVLVGVIGRC